MAEQVAHKHVTSADEDNGIAIDAMFTPVERFRSTASRLAFNPVTCYSLCEGRQDNLVDTQTPNAYDSTQAGQVYWEVESPLLLNLESAADGKAFLEEELKLFLWSSIACKPASAGMYIYTVRFCNL